MSEVSHLKVTELELMLANLEEGVILACLGNHRVIDHAIHLITEAGGLSGDRLGALSSVLLTSAGVLRAYPSLPAPSRRVYHRAFKATYDPDESYLAGLSNFELLSGAFFLFCCWAGVRHHGILVARKGYMITVEPQMKLVYRELQLRGPALFSYEDSIDKS